MLEVCRAFCAPLVLEVSLPLSLEGLPTLTGFTSLRQLAIGELEIADSIVHRKLSASGVKLTVRIAKTIAAATRYTPACSTVVMPVWSDLSFELLTFRVRLRCVILGGESET